MVTAQPYKRVLVQAEDFDLAQELQQLRSLIARKQAPSSALMAWCGSFPRGRCCKACTLSIIPA